MPELHRKLYVRLSNHAAFLAISLILLSVGKEKSKFIFLMTTAAILSSIAKLDRQFSEKLKISETLIYIKISTNTNYLNKVNINVQ